MVLHTILLILNLLGAIGLFLFGIKILSDSLKAVAGNKMRTILYNMTSNRVRGVLTGLLVTAVIQSSSATTVMVVSLVNSGLLPLVGAISVIMGANIGTTVTAWIISLLGFSISMSEVSLVLIGMTFMLLFSQKAKMKAISEIFIGFGLIFIGLQFLQQGIPDVTTNPDTYAFLAKLTDLGYISIVLFVLVGLFITVVVQSSSASMALTLVLCFNGILTFECAAAMVIGENIGTTVTALLASAAGNKEAKRAALSHLIFNVSGAFFALLLFNPFVNLCDNIMMKMSGVSILHGDMTTQEVKNALPIGLSIFHSIFNVGNTLILIWFVNKIALLVNFLIKGENTIEEFNLKYITQGLMSTNELSIIQAKKEIAYMSERTKIMMDIIIDMLKEKNTDALGTLMERMDRYENISDKMQWEITKYLTDIAVHGDVGDEVSKRILAMLKIVNEIENIGDIADQIGKTILDKHSFGIHYSKEMYDDLWLIIDAVKLAYRNMESSLNGEYHLIDTRIGDNLEVNINKIRGELITKYTKYIKAGDDSDFLMIINFKEIFNTVERIGDIIQHVNYAIAECK